MSGTGDDLSGRARRPRDLLWWSALLTGVVLRAISFNTEIAQPHAWRQAHVASNIEYFVVHGPGIVTDTFEKRIGTSERFSDAPGPVMRMFDGPVYQNLASLVCRLTGLDGLRAARVINLIVFLGLAGIMDAILRRLSFRPRVSRLAVLAYALSPLAVHYESGALPDSLAALCGALSVLAYLHVVESGRDRRSSWGWMIVLYAASLTGTLIKNTVTLPALIGIAAHAAATRRELLRAPWFIALGALNLVDVVAFKAFSNHVNVGAWRTPPEDYAWYFGSIGERLRPRGYWTLFNRIWLEAVTPLVSTLGLLGLIIAGRRTQTPARWLLGGWFAGALLTMFIFFNVNLIHDYYQLPFVTIASLIAAIGMDALCATAENHGRVVQLEFTAALVLLLAWSGVQFRIKPIVQQELVNQGRFLRDHVPPGGFVMPILDDPRPSPELLYHARRDGFTISLDALDPAYLETIIAAFTAGHTSFHVFVPANLSAPVRQRLTGLKLTPVAETTDGSLLQIVH